MLWALLLALLLAKISLDFKRCSDVAFGASAFLPCCELFVWGSPGTYFLMRSESSSPVFLTTVGCVRQSKSTAAWLRVCQKEAQQKAC